MTSNETHQQLHAEEKQAFNGQIRSYRIELCDIRQKSRDNKEKVRAILQETRSTIKNLLETSLTKHGNIQATIKLQGSVDEYDYQTLSFKATKQLISFDINSNISLCLDYLINNIKWKFNKYDSKNANFQCSIHFHYLYLYIHELKTPDENDANKFMSSLLQQMNGISNPIQLDDLSIVEDNNEFSINVYMKKKNGQTLITEGPVYHTQARKDKHINLLLKEENGRYKYSYHDLNAEFEPTSQDHRFCDGCFGYFKAGDFEHHQAEECLKLKITCPTETSIKFSNTYHSNKLPFVVYAHIETIVDNVKRPKPKRQHNRVWVTNTHKDLPHSYGYYIKCVDDTFSKARVECWQDNCIQSFTENLFNDLQEQWAKYKTKYSKTKNIIKYIPVILVSLEKNANHLIKFGHFDSYLSRLEKYFTLQKKLYSHDASNYTFVKFIDFSNYIKEPLEDAVENLKFVKDGFKDMPPLVDECFKEKVNLLSEELRFTRNHAKSKYDLNKSSLPTLPADPDESEKKLYQNSMNAWEGFQCNNIGDYLDVYVRCKLYQTANVIEHLRHFCSSHYNLDPMHYMSIASFSWDAMLKMTETELELVSDVEMISFIKKGIRGGNVQCNKRHAKANNRYLNSFDDKEVESYIMYLDANNLGGHIMCQYLPYGGFRWTDTNVDYNVAADSKVGYILEVDLSYPSNLHDEHSDLPFCPKKRNVYGADTEFLIADFDKKKRYVIHHSLLALCVEHGLQVEKIHRVLEFKQKPWLKKYIDFNTDNRKTAGNKCEENFFKLLNNTIQGKTIQNPNNSGKIELFHHFDDLEDMRGASSSIFRADCSGFTICSESSVAIEFKKTRLRFLTPLYAGFCISDLAKMHMSKFHYNVIKKELKDKVRLLYTDTDSLIYQFTNIDSYEFIKKHVVENAELRELGTGFDTSDYFPNNIFRMPLGNHKEPGYFKDELNGAIVKEFVGLQPKVYALSYYKLYELGHHDLDNLTTNAKAARVPKDIRDNFKAKHYSDRVYYWRSLYRTYDRIKAVDFDVYQQKVRRIILSPNDPQRDILSDGVNTLPKGYKGEAYASRITLQPEAVNIGSVGLSYASQNTNTFRVDRRGLGNGRPTH